MTEHFTYDVFLSHSSKDKPEVRPIAELLKSHGLKVWFDEWQLRPGDNIPHKVEEGLENSRILLLVMSANAFGSDWAKLESNTFRFRDPLNKERRFLPLKLDNTTPKGSLNQFLYIDWQTSARAQSGETLLTACQPAKSDSPVPTPPQQLLTEKIISLGHADSAVSVAWSPDGRRALSASFDNTVRLWDAESGGCLSVLEGHTGRVESVAWSPDGRRALSGSHDATVRLWDVESGACLRVLAGHNGSVVSVAWSPDGRRALSGSYDKTVRLWDVESGACLRVLAGHTDMVFSVAWSPDGRRALSGSNDKTVRLWDVESGGCLRVLKGHTDSVFSVAWSPDGRRALSGSDDKTVRLWDVESGGCLRVLKGHTDSVWSVAWSPDGRRALSGSNDKTVRLWDVESGTCLGVLEGHTSSVWSVAWSPDGRRALSGSKDNTVRLWEVESGACLRVLAAHTGSVLSVAWSPDGRRALSGSADNTVRLWEVKSAGCLRVLEGHTDSVGSVAWSPDGRRALSGSYDKTVRLWDVESGACLRVLAGHTDMVFSVAWSPDGRRALSGSDDNSVRLWDVESGGCLGVLEGHTETVWSVAWSPDGRRALSGSNDKRVRLWDAESGTCLRVLEGHTGYVFSVAWSPDGRRALSGSNDKTVRLWDVESGTCLGVLEGHTDSVVSVAWSPDGRRALSGSYDKTVRLWDVESGGCLRVLEGHTGYVLSVAWSPDGRHALSASQNGVMRVWDLSTNRIPGPEAATQYTNAKVLIVGDSGAGKTGLSTRLSQNLFQDTNSTVGAWATHLKITAGASADTEREIWLWDFGGQADQRIIHQLYMEETALAVLVFDGQKTDLFETLGQWDRDITRASRKPFAKLLAAGRVDAGGLRTSREQITTFANQHGFHSEVFETSALTGAGCEQLKQAIIENIDWKAIPFRSSSLLFKKLKDEIIKLKDEGRVLMRFNELRDSLYLRMAGTNFKEQELKAVVSLLSGPGVVWELAFGNLILLQPELINAYAQAVIQTLREDQQERGCLPEDRVLEGKLAFHPTTKRLAKDDERLILIAMHQTLVERGRCFREHTEAGGILIFPSYYRRERPPLTGHPAVLVTYTFTGFLDEIYATLVVRLHHTKPFEKQTLWRYAADFQTRTGKQLGIKLTRRPDGQGELAVYFDPAIATEEKILFSRYVHDYLHQRAQDVVRLRHYICEHCSTQVSNREVAMKRLKSWLEGQAKTEPPTVVCIDCEKRVQLWDDLEQDFASEETRKLVYELQKQSDTKLDNESKERALVGEVISTVALAGQISRECNVSDHGIDMEIEFKTDSGQATGQKLYLQLKSGDSYLRKQSKSLEAIFTIKKKRHAEYWMKQAFPVLLIIRNAEGEVRWMEIRDWLKTATNNGQNPVSLIPFKGERFDVMSVRRWREQLLPKIQPAKA